MPREVRYCRPKSHPAETLLSYLSHKFTYLSRDAWTPHLSEGHVFVNGVVSTNGDYVLQQGDTLRFAPPRSLEPRVDETNIHVLYEDAALLVCAKNGNLPVAEGGRYCENTLIGVLRRRGTRAFYTADTVVRGATEGCELSKVMMDTAANTLSEPCEARSTSAGKRTRETPPPPWDDLSLTRAASSSSSSGPQRGAAPGDFFTVQRLDKETSGVLVLCKNSSTAKSVAAQLERQTRRCSAAVEARVSASRAAFTDADFDAILGQNEKTVRKTYTAVLLGAAPVGASFVVVNTMGSMQRHPTYANDPAHSQLKKLKVCCEPLTFPSSSSSSVVSEAPPPSQWGKVACTRVRVLANSATLGLSCVQVELLTGRSHQIRVHCASLGYPVVGDKLYSCVSPGRSDGCVAVADAVYLARVRNEEDPFVCVENGAVEGRRMWCSRHLLHATELQFEHPTRCPAEVMTFAASPVELFSRDVHFDAAQDAQCFQSLLKEAFQPYEGCNTTQ